MSEKIREAATVILVREDGRLYWVKRAKTGFLGSFHVFPGGAVDKADGSPEVAAIRETFEEIGVLLVPGADKLSSEDREVMRAALLEAGGKKGPQVAFVELLSKKGLRVDESLLIPAGRFMTPPFSPVRFDTRFYVARLPEGAEASVIPGELESGEWIAPAYALARWRADEAILAAPTKLTLDVLATTPGDPASPDWLQLAAASLARSCPPAGDWTRRVELRPGIYVYPVRTPTLPPATHTNVVLVGEGRDLVAIDPASPYEDERAGLDALVARFSAEGRRVTKILLTHRHEDHVSGAEHLARRTGAPILAHAAVKEALRGKVEVSETIDDGWTIDLPAEAPRRSRRLRAVLTEGHARGHLAFFEETSRTVVAGDMVAGFGWIIIDPPEGDMVVYLRSLQKIKDLDARLMFPAHGPPIGDPAGKVDEYVSHRLAREAKVRVAIEAGARSLEAVVEKAYDDTPRPLWPLAARSALAHVLKLEHDGTIAAGAVSR